MKRLTLVFLTLLIFIIVTCSAFATLFPNKVANDVYSIATGGLANGIPSAKDNNDLIPDIFQAVNQLLGTTYTHNWQVDSLFYQPDSIWQQQLNGTVALIGLTAGYSNTLGVYTDLGVGSAKTSVIGPYSGYGFKGTGTIGSPYPAATLGLAYQSLYGFYLKSVNSSSTAYYYSEDSLNPSGWDHMMTFDLKELSGTSIYINKGAGPESYTFNHPYLLAWEDQNMGDEDYDDMMYVIDGISSPVVPEPGTLLLLGSGLVGFAGYARIRISRKNK